MVGDFLKSIYRLGKSTALVLASVAVTLIALEVILRLWDGIPILSSINFVDRGFNAIVNPQNPLAQFDDRLGWAQVPNRSWVTEHPKQLHYTFGEYGARLSNSQIVPLQQGAILVVGDSFAGGSDVNDGETWPAYLEKLTGIQVINAAAGGYGFDQIVLRAEDLLPKLNPKILLVQTNLAFGISLTRMSVASGAPKPYFVPQEGRLILKNEPVPRSARRAVNIGWQRAIFGYSYLVQYIMTRLNLLQWWISPPNMRNKLTLSDREAVEVSCLLMQRLGDLHDRYKTPVALVIQYGALDGIDSTVAWEKDRAYVTHCAEQQHLPVADIHQALHRVHADEGPAAYQKLWIMSDAERAYGHMSPAGNELVANVVFQKLFSAGISEVNSQSVGR